MAFVNPARMVYWESIEMATEGKKKGKTIWLTPEQYALINESRELFRLFTGVKLSWGAYLGALSLGALTAKALSGFLMRCPNCGAEVEMILRKPRLHREARPARPRESPPVAPDSQRNGAL